MIIEKLDPQRECFNDFSLDGDTLTIGGIEVDLAAEEQDQEVVIAFGKCKSRVHRGLMPTCVYVAEILIPPRKYETSETIGEDEDVKIKTTPIPIDTNAVTLRLWPVVDRASSETNMMEENHVSE